MWNQAVALIILANSVTGVYFKDVQIETQITNHLSETTIVMGVHNEKSICPAHTTFDLQLPKTAFLSEMILTEETSNCTFVAKFLPAKKAQAGFDGAVRTGRSAALIKSYTLGQVQLSLSVPGNATSKLTIVYTEVLRKENGQVRLQLPIDFGHWRVEGDITATVNVREAYGVHNITCAASARRSEVKIREMTSTHADKSVSIFIPAQAEGRAFSTVIKCAYTPNALPDGILLVEPTDLHFLYVFAPPAPKVAAVHKAIGFVIDLSGSMWGSRLANAKKAFKYMVSQLTSNDCFSVSVFEDRIHLAAFGPVTATGGAIKRALEYINGLRAEGGTNLHDAVVQGITHVRKLVEHVHVAGAVTPVLVLLTDGQATTGTTDGRTIVRHALAENAKAEPRVPLYALALGSDADASLLQTLTTFNGGDTIRIYEGFGDSTDQMKAFYKENLKHIVMHQVAVKLDHAVTSNTDLTFPLLNAGAEVVVTGQLAATKRRGAAADCAAAKKACQDFCCQDPAGPGPNQNICDGTQMVCKCFLASSPASISFTTHKKQFQQACNKGSLGIKLNQGFTKTRCAACGAGSPNCNNNQPAPAQSCKQLLAGTTPAATAPPTKPATKPDAGGATKPPSSGCAVSGGCEYVMKASDTLASVATARKTSSTDLKCLNPGFTEGGAGAPSSTPMCPSTNPYRYRPIDGYDYCCTTNTFSSKLTTAVCDGKYVKCKDKDGADTKGCADYKKAAPATNAGKKLKVPCPKGSGGSGGSGGGDSTCTPACPSNKKCIEGACICLVKYFVDGICQSAGGDPVDTGAPLLHNALTLAAALALPCL